MSADKQTSAPKKAPKNRPSEEPQKGQNKQAWLGRLTKSLVILFSWLPLGVNQFFGRVIGRFLWWIPNENRRNTLINLKIAFPEMTEAERKALAKQSLLHLGMMATELGPAWTWSKSKLLSLVKEVEGQEHLDEVLAKVNQTGEEDGDKKRGIIFLSPHIGAWELSGSFLSMHYPSTFLYREPKLTGGLKEFILESRQRFGAELVPTDMRGVRTLIQALKQSRVTGILPDQDAGKKGGIHAPFFGQPARTMTLVSKLIQKTDCEFLFIIFERLPKAQGYRVHYLPAEADMASKDEVLATAALNRGVEACISVMPEQYLWSYRRFRQPPEGYENPYK